MTTRTGGKRKEPTELPAVVGKKKGGKAKVTSKTKAKTKTNTLSVIVPAAVTDMGAIIPAAVAPAAATEVVALGSVSKAKKPGRKRIKRKVKPLVYPSRNLPSISEDGSGEEEVVKDFDETEAEETEEQAGEKAAAKDADEEVAKESDKERVEDVEDESTPSSPNSLIDEQFHSEEEEDNSVPEFEERELTVSTALTVDEDLCLKYFLGGGDKPQPRGKKGRFTTEELETLIEDTKQGHCLLIPKGRDLQLLHSAFMWEEWVYASAATSGVDDYWIRIPVKALVKSMAGLDFKLWKTKGQPVLGKGITTLNGLAHQSSSFQDFLSQNDLREVSVSVAQKSSRPGSATLITGEMYALLCQHVGSVTGDPGFFVKTIDALFALREWTNSSISNPHLCY